MLDIAVKLRLLKDDESNGDYVPWVAGLALAEIERLRAEVASLRATCYGEAEAWPLEYGDEETT